VEFYLAAKLSLRTGRDRPGAVAARGDPRDDESAMLSGLPHLIESIEIIRPDPQRPIITFERFPDASTLLFFTHGLGLIAVSGPFLRTRRKSAPRALSLALHLKPAAASVLFDAPMSELAGAYARLDDLWGDESRELHERVLSADGVDNKLEQILAAVHRRASRRAEPLTARLARRAMELMQRSAEPVRVDALAAALGVTARHLRRAFASNVGLGPKEVARVLRLKRAMLAARSNASFCSIAAHAGFYDQAHMIGDFRSMLGVTPERYRRRLLHGHPEPIGWAEVASPP
jgi:AraC-like DNA-binding protein